MLWHFNIFKKVGKISSFPKTPINQYCPFKFQEKSYMQINESKTLCDKLFQFTFVYISCILTITLQPFQHSALSNTL